MIWINKKLLVIFKGTEIFVAQYKESYGTFPQEHFVLQYKSKNFSIFLLEKYQKDITFGNLKYKAFLHYENQDLMANNLCNLCQSVDYGPPLFGSCIKFRPLSWCNLKLHMCIYVKCPRKEWAWFWEPIYVLRIHQVQSSELPAS